MSKDRSKVVLNKDEEIDKYKRKVAELEAQLLKITGAPLVKELNLPDGFVGRSFSDQQNELSSMGQAKKITTIELSEVDMDHFNNVDVMDRFIEMQSLHREHNRSNDEVEKMKEGKLSKCSSSRATEIQNTLRVFFGFCNRMFDKVDFRHVLDERVIAAFPVWYKQMGRQPSSTANHLKNLKAFMKFLMGQQVFFNYVTKITSVIETIKPLQAVYNKLANSSKYTLTDEKMRLLGMWLSEPEFLLLNKFVCDFLVKKFEEDEDFVREKSDRTVLSRSDVALIQDHVYLLGLMYLGGQRNQFVASLSTKNVVFEGSLTKYLKTHEKVNRQKVDYFKFPLTFSVMIRVWMTRYLPLVRGPEVEACWVSGTGLAYSHSKMGERVAPVVAIYFPGRHITPIYFRRAIVTFVKGKTFSTDATGIDSFFKEKLAVLMNTSPDIIDMHYDRMHRADVNKKTLDTVNDAVGLAPTEALAALVRDLAEGYDAEAEDYRKGAVEVVSHCFVTANNPEFTVAFEGGVRKVLNWTEMSPLLSLVDVYWAKVGGPRTKKVEPVLPKKWGMKPRKKKSSGEKESDEKESEAAPKDKSAERAEEDEGEDNDFGLDRVPDLVSSEEENEELDLMAMVDRSVVSRTARKVDARPVVEKLPEVVVVVEKMDEDPRPEPASPASKTSSPKSAFRTFPVLSTLTSIFRKLPSVGDKRKAVDLPLGDPRPKKKTKN